LKKRREALSLEAPFTFFNILLLMIKFILHFHIYYYHMFWIILSCVLVLN